MVLLEVCLESIEDAVAAEQAGADRLELNAALELDGLTPSAGVVQAVRSQVGIPIVAMLRPRPGDFCYGRTEFKAMEADLEQLLEAGAGAIACGILTAEGRIDHPRCAALIKRAAGNPVVFHRAFDLLADPLAALDELIDLGVTRLLTSGTRRTALEGAAIIRTLLTQAHSRIEILPGGGLHAGNILRLVQSTGCRQIHGTFRRKSAAAERQTTGPFVSGLHHTVRPDLDAIAQVRRLLDRGDREIS